MLLNLLFCCWEKRKFLQVWFERHWCQRRWRRWTRTRRSRWLCRCTRSSSYKRCCRLELQSPAMDRHLSQEKNKALAGNWTLDLLLKPYSVKLIMLGRPKLKKYSGKPLLRYIVLEATQGRPQSWQSFFKSISTSLVIGSSWSDPSIGPGLACCILFY